MRGSGSNVRVGVAAEVRLHRLMKSVNIGREAGKTVGYVTRGAGSKGGVGVGVGVAVEVGSARVKAIVRDEVERREKILRCVSRREEFENVRIYVRGCRRDVLYSRREDGGLRHLEGRVSVGVTL